MNRFGLCGRTLVMSIVVVLAAGCSLKDGDYLGPAERELRTLTNGWDMWDSASITPYESPRPATVPDVLGRPRPMSFEDAQAAADRLSPESQVAAGRLAYRRYCHHCHGLNGDGRIIVGESFDVRLPDLRSDTSQGFSDEEMFGMVTDGTVNMVALADTVTPLDLVLAIRHVRTLKNAPSTPFYSPRNTEPFR